MIYTETPTSYRGIERKRKRVRDRERKEGGEGGNIFREAKESMAPGVVELSHRSLVLWSYYTSHIVS